jgi:isoleucyl-tRNA synthetase
MELDWLKNMQDWLISKKRYWGLALPIWECSCGHFEVVGSKEELRKKAISGWEKFSGHTPHRPWIDEIRIRCSSCGGVASRIPDVGNPWLDAGIVPFSTLEYRTSKVYWREWFPADFITECFPGQFKNWFYSLLVMSTVLENTNPFRAIFGYALVRDEKGEEMHKSKGNAIWFDEAAEKMGVDVMRWMYVTQNPEINLNFGYHKADETRRKFHLMLWNVYNFFITYANVDKFRVKEQENKRVEKNILDRWIISRFNQLIQVVTDSLDKYDAFTPSHAIEDFVIDLSTWYVRRSRDRVSPTVPDGDDKNACYSTLYEVLVTLCKLLAPFTPFLAEEIYQNLTGGESVHLADWPISKPRLIDDQLLWEMVQLREMVERAHAIRKKHHLKVRQPLSRLVIIGEEKREKPLWYAYEELIKGELNVKKIEYKPYQEVCDKKGKLPGYSEDDPRHFFLDLKVTPKLKAEGEARELVRQIQELRKKAGCKLDQKVKVYGPKWPREEYLLEYIKRETLATALLPGKELKIATLND